MHKKWITGFGCVLLLGLCQPVFGFVIQTIQDFRRQTVLLQWSNADVRDGIPSWINVEIR